MDKGKSFLNVSIEVKANIAKVSVCFLAVKNLYFIYSWKKAETGKLSLFFFKEKKILFCHRRKY